MVAPPPLRTRAYAMANIAMHDAVNAAAGGPHTSYLTGVSAPGGSQRAAAAQAAHDVLVALNPANAAQYGAALSASLAQVPGGQAKTDGIATGAAYAAAMLTSRANDGSGASIPYMTTGEPGEWRPTPPGFAPYAFTDWGEVDPFLMSSGDQFRPGPPPALDSAEYAAAYNGVKALGSATSATRTLDQTDAALFWSTANGAEWLRVGVTIGENGGLSTVENARAFALLTASLADALISGFDSKLAYRLWRPVTAIHEGDADGNPATAGEPLWESLFAAPPYPSYQGNLSTLSGAGSTVLSAIFGDDESFCFDMAMRNRCFDGLGVAALEAAVSREWGGIHFSFDSAAGLEAGRQIGRLGLESPAFNQVPEPPAVALALGGFALVQLLRRRPAHR